MCKDSSIKKSSKNEPKIDQKEVEGLKCELDFLRNECEKFEEEEEKHKENEEILHDLFERGVIDEKGNLI